MTGDASHPTPTDPRDELALRQALFPGLVYNQAGDEAPVVMIGGVAHYAIPDDGFMRHVEAYRVDNYVVAALQEQVLSMREELVQGILQMMGTDDILTKAAIEASISNMGQNIRQSDPSQWAPMLRVYGFRIVVDVHGQVVEIMHPAQPGVDDDE
jgi:hypothetical protein